MKIVEPKVYDVSGNFVNWGAVNQFFADYNLKHEWTPTANDSDQIPEIAGRLCYLSYGQGRKTNKEYLDNIKSMRHFSVIEHSSFGFIVAGVSRSFSHELVRHRHLSFSQLSQRYVDEKIANFVEPEIIKNIPEAHNIWQGIVEKSHEAYNKLVEILGESVKDEPFPTARKKAARQAARAVLPNATETMIYVSGNARAWRHFINLRATAAAEPEIRNIALQVLKLLKWNAPNLFDDYEIKEENGITVASTEFTEV